MWAHARGHRADGRGDNHRVCGGRADRGDPQRRIGCLGEHDERNKRAAQHHANDRVFEHHTPADERVGDALAAGRRGSDGHHASHHASSGNDARPYPETCAETDTHRRTRTDRRTRTNRRTYRRTDTSTDRRLDGLSCADRCDRSTSRDARTTLCIKAARASLR